MAKRFIYIRPAGGITYDTDAQAYFTAAGITDTGQKNAYNSFVLTGKADGWYSKLIALYPLIGGSSSTHAVNAKTPGTYNLTFIGSPTHSSNGIQWDGSSQYATTGLTPTAGSLTLNDNSLIFYSRTSAASTAGQYFDMGGGETSGGGAFSIFTYRDDNSAGYDPGNEPGARVSFSPGGDGSGLYVGSSVSGTAYVYKNGSQLATDSSLSGSVPSSVDLAIGGWRHVAVGTNTASAIYYSPRQGCFYAYGLGLTTTEITSISTAINTMQTSLGRNVY